MACGCSEAAAEIVLNEIVRLRKEVAQLESLRQGDNELILALAADAGITITCAEKMLGNVWEQFHDGVIRMKRRIEELSKQ